MVPNGANECVLGLEKNDGRPRKREEAQTEDVCQSEGRGNPLHACQFCGTEFIDLCCPRLYSVGPLCLIKETFALCFLT